MYSRFLKEAVKITGIKALGEASAMFNESGKIFSEIGLMFKDAQTMADINEKIEIASKRFEEIADMEERAFTYLKENI